MTSTTTCDVFVSYAHEDSWCKEELVTMLAPMLRDGSISLFEDSMIVPGTPWDEKLMDMLTCPRVAVLLVSPNFLNSEYIMDREWPLVKDRAEAGNVTLFWIPVESSLVDRTEIAQYQAAWPPDKPLRGLSPAKRSEALKAICHKLIAALNP